MDVLTAVLDQLNAQTAPELAAALIEATGMSTAEGLPAAALLKAIESRQFELGDLILNQKQALRSHPDAANKQPAESLMAAGGGLPDADRDKVLKS